MNRRDFIKYLLATPIAVNLDIEKLLWVPEKTIFLPPIADSLYIVLHPDQYDFYMSLAGLPYHAPDPDATVGTWLGINRSTTPQFKPDWRNRQTHH